MRPPPVSLDRCVSRTRQYSGTPLRSVPDLPAPDVIFGAHLPDPHAVPPANALDSSFDLKYRVIDDYWTYMFLYVIAVKWAV